MRKMCKSLCLVAIIMLPALVMAQDVATNCKKEGEMIYCDDGTVIKAPKKKDGGEIKTGDQKRAVMGGVPEDLRNKDFNSEHSKDDQEVKETRTYE